MTAPRIFVSKPATREAVPVLVGLVGPSGSGKTFSALRLATGMQRVTGGDIYVIDTEARRALHYAEQFRFKHLVFDAPFSPLDYLAAIEHCVAAGAKVIVIDSMSHEHEGPGGVLEMHSAAVERLSKGDEKKADRVNMLAWSEPKQQRRRLLNGIVQLGCNVVLCFRAKEKLKMIPGRQPEPLGWMPIGGEEHIYEMTVAMSLPPGSSGEPDWHPERPGERAMVKLPLQFDWLRSVKGPLDEASGERMARWAAGTTQVSDDQELLAAIEAAWEIAQLEVLLPQLKQAAGKDTLREAYKARKAAILSNRAAHTPDPDGYADDPHVTAPTEDERRRFLEVKP